jgi:colanic acid/amylovoran biosynthesis protein
MKLVIVNAFGRSNRGDSVLLDECIGQLRQVYPDAQISGVVFEGIENARAVHPTVAWSERIGSTKNGIGIANSKAKALLYLFAAWIAALAPWSGFDRFLPQHQRETLAAIRNADTVISAPGGYIHDTNLAYFIALFHIYLGTALGKTVVLAPQSIGPIEGWFSRWVARRVLGKVPYICARESYSFDFLTKELGFPASRVFRAGDSAFWNEEVDRDSAMIDREYAKLGVQPGQAVFGMTVVDWSFPRSADPKAAAKAYVAALARIADHISQTYQLIPVIFNQVSGDLSTAYEVRKRARHPIIIDEMSRDPPVLRALMARSAIFLGTRFHSCIFAMIAGRPTFAIAYLPKTEFIMNDLHLAARHTPIQAIDIDAIIKQFSSDLENLALAESAISTAVFRYRCSFARFEDIMNLVIREADTNK